jgi:hypothetical protein
MVLITLICADQIERYTGFVRITISLPDDLFRLAEAVARKLRMSRSQLYATTIAAFLARCRTSRITERLNEIYSEEPAKLDPALHSAQIISLESDSW